MNSVDINILDHASMTAHRFESQSRIGSGKNTIPDTYIARAAVAFAPNDETAVRMVHNAICYDNVLA